jgi:hypothetical protein
VPLIRPPRPPAGAVTDALRGAILRRASENLGFDEAKVLSLHTGAEFVRDTRALFADVELRYDLASGALQRTVLNRLMPPGGGAFNAAVRRAAQESVFSGEAASVVLLALPDTEFLTAIEHAVALGHEKRLYGIVEDSFFGDRRDSTADSFFSYADDALAAHGAPYRRADDDWLFEWIGDPAQHELVVQPALRALDDQRLTGPRAEFDEALHKRRLGTPKDLEDAVDEAAKAVESILKVLHDECDVRRPRSEHLTALFNSLVAGDVLPGYVDKLVASAAGPRNKMASHGQGSTVREVREELADASIAAAATAITFLAHYLP